MDHGTRITRTVRHALANLGEMSCPQNCAFQEVQKTSMNALAASISAGRALADIICSMADVHSWVSRCKLKETWSMLPLYFVCLDHERLRLAQICDAARKLGTPARSIIEFRTDSVLIEGISRAKKLESLNSV